MSPTLTFLLSWNYWFRTTLIGIILGILLVQGETWWPSSPPLFLPAEKVSEPTLTMSKHLLSTPASRPERSLFLEVLEHSPPILLPPPPASLSPRKIIPKARPLPYYSKYVPVPKGISPNSVRLHVSQVPPIAGDVKMVKGRPTCPKKNDKPKKSKENKRAHIDRECCLDPDEIPHPRCAY